MAKRKFSGQRLYKLLKRLVVAITVLSLITAIYTGFMLETNTLLNRWEKYCGERYPTVGAIKSWDYWDCMGVGLEQINQQNDVFGKSVGVAIFLPLVFFGGTWLFKYLFPETILPKKNKKGVV